MSPKPGRDVGQRINLTNPVSVLPVKKRQRERESATCHSEQVNCSLSPFFALSLLRAVGVCVCSGEGGAEIHPHIAERQTAERMMPVLRLHEHEIRMVVRGCGRYYPRFYKQSLKIFVFSNLLLCFCNSVMYCSLDHLCSLSLSWSLLSRGGWCDFKWNVFKSQLTNFHSIARIIANKAN